MCSESNVVSYLPDCFTDYLTTLLICFSDKLIYFSTFLFKMLTFTSVSLNFKIHLNKPVYAQGAFILFNLLYSDTEINIIRVANSNLEVMSSGRLNNATI